MADVNKTRVEDPGFDPRLFLRDEELDYGIGLILSGERRLLTEALDHCAPEGLPPLAIRILLTARFQPGQTVSALRTQLGATVPTLARVLGELDQRGYIERRANHADGRAKRVYLTVEGKRLTDQATIAMRDLLRNAYRRAGATAVSGARTVLQALSQ
ncbi:MAG: MarR family transcriptional regulator [Pseudomonadota bacterium]